MFIKNIESIREITSEISKNIPQSLATVTAVPNGLNIISKPAINNTIDSTRATAHFDVRLLILNAI